MEELFNVGSVKSNRVIYTPSDFAKTNLLYLQEVGELQAVQPHTNSRENLLSFLFFIVEDGSGTLEYEHTKYNLEKGDCVFINCRKAYNQRSSEDELWRLKWVHFYGFGMNGIYEKYVERGGKCVFRPNETTQFLSAIDNIFEVAKKGDYIRDMRINENLSRLLTLIMAESWNVEQNPHNGLKKQSLQKVKLYIEENYDRHISLDELANNFYINKYYLTRVFKEQFGISINSYQSQIRVTHAKQLLRFSALSVEEIGRRIGIDEAGYFNRVFKRIEGITPGEYRKMW